MIAYKDSPEFRGQAKDTREQYRKHLDASMTKYGHNASAALTAGVVYKIKYASVDMPVAGNRRTVARR